MHFWKRKPLSNAVLRLPETNTICAKHDLIPFFLTFFIENTISNFNQRFMKTGKDTSSNYMKESVIHSSK